MSSPELEPGTSQDAAGSASGNVEPSVPTETNSQANWNVPEIHELLKFFIAHQARSGGGKSFNKSVCTEAALAIAAHRMRGVVKDWKHV